MPVASDVKIAHAPNKGALRGWHARDEFRVMPLLGPLACPLGRSLWLLNGCSLMSAEMTFFPFIGKS